MGTRLGCEGFPKCRELSAPPSRFKINGIVCSTLLAVVDVVGDSVVVVVVVVVVDVVAAVVVVGWGVVVLDVLLTSADSRRFDAEALNDLNSVWKFKSDGCVDGGATDDGLCVDEYGAGAV